MAVLARDPYRIEDVERSGPCYLSKIVGGPGGYRFRFVGFWAMTPTSPEDGYPQQARELVDGLPHDELATVVAGTSTLHRGMLTMLRMWRYWALVAW